MIPEKLISLFSRVLFLGAFVLMGLAVAERFANAAGYTILRQTSYTAGRLLEFAAIFLIFVVAILLREIREELKGSKVS